jgi:amino acid adenylation domain-containing protein
LVGFFVNMLVLRQRVEPATPFRELLRQTRETARAAYAHQEYPFEKLVAELAPARDAGSNPLFQVAVVYERETDHQLRLAGVRTERVWPAVTTSKFDLQLTYREEEGGLRVCVDYRVDLYEAPTIRRLLDHLEEMIGGVLARPEEPVGALPLLPEAERRQLEQWHGPARDYPAGRCLHELVWAQVERTPGAVAVMCGDARWSYRELRERAVAVAGSLRSLGVGPGALVGVFVERSAELVAAVLGVLQSGAAYVPMDPLFPRERLGWMIEDAAMPVIVTQTSLVETLPPNQAKLLCLDEPLPETQDPRPETQTPRSAFRVPLSEDPAYVIFTSGSTGRPKGVVVEHRGVVNVLQSICREPGFTEEDTMLSVTTLSFDIAVAELFLPLITGGRLVLAERATAADGHRLRSLLETCGATFLQPTPVTWRLLLEAGWPGSPDLKMICTGEPLPPDLAAQLLPKGKSLWNLYGPTETTIWSTGCQITDAAGITIGRPLANTQVYIVNEALQLQPVGVPGELLIGGDGVARGYLNRPELTAEKFIPNPFGAGRVYRTGDLARWRADGTLECLGRLDHQVKVRGYRIELGEIEAALALAEGVRQAVVVLREEQLVAYVVPAAAAPSEPMLREHLRGKLPEYMVPARYVTLDKLPLTPNGKIDRQALPEPAGQDAGAPAAAAAAPRNEVERKLVEILGTLLKRQRIGIHDNFFDLGGHSLLVLRMISAVNEHFGCDLPPITLFENPTVASFAAILKPPVPPAPQPVIEPASTPPAMKQPGGATNNGVLRAVAEAIQRGSGSSTAREEAKCPYRMRESWVCKHVLAPLYRRRNSLRLDIKPGIRKLILRLEGGPLFTITLRRLLSEVHKIQIGDYSAASFDPYHLRAGTKIGRYCAIDETVFIRDEDHPRNTISTHAIFFLKRVGFSSGHKLPRANLEIGNDVWVGHGAKILYPTSKIGDGAVIGAGAVVVEDVPPFAIVAGVPARVVKYRFSKETISELQSLKWWDYSLERLAPASDQFMMPIEGDRIY